MLRQLTAIGALAMLGMTAPAGAAPDPENFRKQLDRFVETQMREQKIPGVAVAVLRKGEIVSARGYGSATVEHDVPVTTDTIFQSGSVGKMFTAAAVMTAVEQGRIGLDDPIGKYLSGGAPSWKTVTVRHLLTHTSGIPEFGNGFDYRRDYSDDELVKTAAALPLDFKPGARWNYSNTGYILLGILVKKATGKSYLDVLDAQVFKPLGMKTARGISDGDIVRHRASGYQLVKGELKNHDWVSPTMNSTADGSLYFSLDDVIAWARGVEKGAVLSPTSWKQTYTPVRLNSGKSYPYGFGWSLSQAGGHPRYHHGGAWQGFRTFYSRYLGEDLSVILLTNSAETKLDSFMDGIAGLWDPALVAPGPKPTPEPAIDGRVSALIEKARAGALRKEDIPIGRAGFVDAANPYFSEMLKKLGALKTLELVERSERGDDREYSYVASFAGGTAKVEFSLAPGDQVSGFMIAN